MYNIIFKRFSISPQNKKNIYNKHTSIRSLKVKANQSGGFKSVFKGLVYVEIGFFIGSYLLWKRMNDSREFRHYMSKSFPAILEGYYTLGEQLGGLEIRKTDNEFWNSQNDQK